MIFNDDFLIEHHDHFDPDLCTCLLMGVIDFGKLNHHIRDPICITAQRKGEESFNSISHFDGDPGVRADNLDFHLASLALVRQPIFKHRPAGNWNRNNSADEWYSQNDLCPSWKYRPRSSVKPTCYPQRHPRRAGAGRSIVAETHGSQSAGLGEAGAGGGDDGIVS